MAAYLRQDTYRWGNNSSVSSRSWKAAINTAIDTVKGSLYILRFHIRNTGDALPSGQWTLWCSRNGGAYFQVTDSSSYVLLTNSSYVTDGGSISTSYWISNFGEDIQHTGDQIVEAAGDNYASTTLGGPGFPDDQTGETEVEYVVYLSSNLADGDYLNFRVRNGSSTFNYYANTARANIVEFDDPVFTDTPDNTFAKLGGSLSLSWTATDANPDNYIIKRDTTQIDSGTWSSGSPINYNGTAPTTAGTYTYSCTVYDDFDNSAYDSALVYVREIKINQTDFRFAKDSDLHNRSSDDWLAEKNTNITLKNGETVRIRFHIKVNNAYLTNAWTMYMSKDGGSWTQVTTTSNDFRSDVNGTGDADGDSIANTYWIASDASYVDVTGEYNENGNVCNVDVTGWSSKETELEWCVRAYNATPKSDYRFKLVNTDTNSYNYIVYPTITIFEEDDPVITSSPNDITMSTWESKTLSWTATDENPDNYVIKRGTTQVASGSWSSGTPVTYEIEEDSLSEGTYTYTITFYDENVGETSDSVNVTVWDSKIDNTDYRFSNDSLISTRTEDDWLAAINTPIYIEPGDEFRLRLHHKAYKANFSNPGYFYFAYSTDNTFWTHNALTRTSTELQQGVSSTSDYDGMSIVNSYWITSDGSYTDVNGEYQEGTANDYLNNLTMTGFTEQETETEVYIKTPGVSRGETWYVSLIYYSKNYMTFTNPAVIYVNKKSTQDRNVSVNIERKAVSYNVFTSVDVERFTTIDRSIINDIEQKLYSDKNLSSEIIANAMVDIDVFTNVELFSKHNISLVTNIERILKEDKQLITNIERFFSTDRNVDFTIEQQIKTDRNISTNIEVDEFSDRQVGMIIGAHARVDRSVGLEIEQRSKSDREVSVDVIFTGSVDRSLFIEVEQSFYSNINTSVNVQSYNKSDKNVSVSISHEVLDLAYYDETNSRWTDGSYDSTRIRIIDKVIKLKKDEGLNKLSTLKFTIFDYDTNWDIKEGTIVALGTDFTWSGTPGASSSSFVKLLFEGQVTKVTKKNCTYDGKYDLDVEAVHIVNTLANKYAYWLISSLRVTQGGKEELCTSDYHVDQLLDKVIYYDENGSSASINRNLVTDGNFILHKEYVDKNLLEILLDLCSNSSNVYYCKGTTFVFKPKKPILTSMYFDYLTSQQNWRYLAYDSTFKLKSNEALIANSYDISSGETMGNDVYTHIRNYSPYSRKLYGNGLFLGKLVDDATYQTFVYSMIDARTINTYFPYTDKTLTGLSTSDIKFEYPLNRYGSSEEGIDMSSNNVYMLGLKQTVSSGNPVIEIGTIYPSRTFQPVNIEKNLSGGGTDNIYRTGFEIPVYSWIADQIRFFHPSIPTRYIFWNDGTQCDEWIQMGWNYEIEKYCLSCMGMVGLYDWSTPGWERIFLAFKDFCYLQDFSSDLPNLTPGISDDISKIQWRNETDEWEVELGFTHSIIEDIGLPSASISIRAGFDHSGNGFKDCVEIKLSGDGTSDLSGIFNKYTNNTKTTLQTYTFSTSLDTIKLVFNKAGSEWKGAIYIYNSFYDDWRIVNDWVTFTGVSSGHSMTMVIEDWVNTTGINGVTIRERLGTNYDLDDDKITKVVYNAKNVPAQVVVIGEKNPEGGVKIPYGKYPEEPSDTGTYIMVKRLKVYSDNAATVAARYLYENELVENVKVTLIEDNVFNFENYYPNMHIVLKDTDYYINNIIFDYITRTITFSAGGEEKGFYDYLSVLAKEAEDKKEQELLNAPIMVKFEMDSSFSGADMINNPPDSKDDTGGRFFTQDDVPTGV